MAYLDAKVYFDGSHYIAIPHITRFVKKRKLTPEEPLMQGEQDLGTPKPCLPLPSRKALFNELYKEHIDLPRRERVAKITQAMTPYFKDNEQCQNFLQRQMERKKRNLIARRTRMFRKASLIDFNYFATFTYDDAKHTEQSFKKGLQTCFRNLCYRQHWQYLGVWERAPVTKRLHFHGLFRIASEAMVGELFSHTDYNLSLHKRTTTIQNSYFNGRFGRTDFEYIASNKDLIRELQYICKYLEKTEERIVYSKGLYQYFVSDIMNTDVVCRIGREDRKLLLFDDFTCINTGKIQGKVSPTTIAKMRKSN